MSGPPRRMGMSLYADLLDSNTPAKISGAPVTHDKPVESDVSSVKKKDASLQFQPIKRPQAAPKNRPKQVPSSTHKVALSSTITSSSSPAQASSNSIPNTQPNLPRSNFEDWAVEEDDEYFDERQGKERGRKRRKRQKETETRVWSWDDVYDPHFPNRYADYKGSDEQYRENSDWKRRLHHHQNLDIQRRSSRASHDSAKASPSMNKMFAPPSNLNFAPPTFGNDRAPSAKPAFNNGDDHDRSSPNPIKRSEQDHAKSSVVDLSSDSSSARLESTTLSERTSGESQVPVQGGGAASDAMKRAQAQAKIDAFKAKLAAHKAKTATASATNVPETQQETVIAEAPSIPPPPSSPPPPPPPEEPRTTISRGPVRYEQPRARIEPEIGNLDAPEPPSDEDAPRSNRPGQKGFAQRMLKKYGWKEGEGLGAQGEGITTAIVAQAEKRKKRSDAEGGGWARPANMGKIMGGKRRKIESKEADDGQFGKMSEVIKLEGMLDGLDVDHEISEKNLMQEIGDEMGTNGTIERIFIWRQEMGGKNDVFVKFTSQLSALKAVSSTDGMTFADNSVAARFFPLDKFESGDYV